MAREFFFEGKTIDELQKMTIKDFAQLVKSRARRKLIKRGYTEEEKKLIADIKEGFDPIKTHCRETVITPLMIGKTIYVYTGRDWARVEIRAELLGDRLGEFAETRKRVRHGSPGMGATKSSMFVPLK